VDLGSESSSTVSTLFLAYNWAITVAWASDDFAALQQASTSSVPASPASTTASIVSSTSSTSTELTESIGVRASPSPTMALPPSSTIPAGELATPTSSNVEPSDSLSSGLSVGAKAGIGVGVGLGCLLSILLLTILIVMLRRKRRNERSVQEGAIESSPHSDLPAGNSHSDTKTAQSYQYGWAEMDGVRQGQKSMYTKPEREDTKYGQQPQPARVELEGS